MCSLTDRPQSDSKQLHDFWVIQSIVDKLTIFAIRDHTGIPQHPQLLGDVSLGTLQHCLKVAHTCLVPPQFIQDAQPRRVGKKMK